jgi:hypothetical protein
LISAIDSVLRCVEGLRSAKVLDAALAMQNYRRAAWLSPPLDGAPLVAEAMNRLHSFQERLAGPRVMATLNFESRNRYGLALAELNLHGARAECCRICIVKDLDWVVGNFRHYSTVGIGADFLAALAPALIQVVANLDVLSRLGQGQSDTPALDQLQTASAARLQTLFIALHSRPCARLADLDYTLLKALDAAQDRYGVQGGRDEMSRAMVAKGEEALRRLSANDSFDPALPFSQHDYEEWIIAAADRFERTSDAQDSAPIRLALQTILDSGRLVQSERAPALRSRKRPLQLHAAFVKLGFEPGCEWIASRFDRYVEG